MIPIIYSCSTNSKISKIKRSGIGATITLSDIHDITPINIESSPTSSDTLTVTDNEGKRVRFIKAVVDSSGTIHATEELEAAVITARFRNIPERNGKVKIGFDIRIPKGIIDNKWQIRFTPTLFILQDTMQLDQVHITGKEYHKRQMRGYELYEQFINSIITDSTQLIYMNLLEIFIDRNFPEIAAIREDTSFIDPSIRGIYNISLLQAREYYTKRVAKYINNRKIVSKEKYYNKYIKSPIITDGIRIDSIIENTDNGITYHYSQWIPTRKGLKKLELVLDGAIFIDGKQIHAMQQTPPLTYYISSFSSMTEDIERYITEVVEKKVVIKKSAKIDFGVNCYEIDRENKNNTIELSKIDKYITEIIINQEFDIDSITISASCSPEGSLKFNTALASKRANHIKKYFTHFIERLIDSIKVIPIEEISMENNDLTYPDEIYEELEERLYTYRIPENWELLFKLIRQDSIVGSNEQILKLAEIDQLDKREKILSTFKEYKYIKEHLYPELRRVDFEFHLSRRGMLKDTIHTSIKDTLYQIGIEALKERDYKRAITILGAYRDINSALAFMSLDYNASAMAILKNLPKSSKRDYLLAIIYSRLGNLEYAAELYLNAIKEDRTLTFRGNLDPEISILIEKFNLHQYEENF